MKSTEQVTIELFCGTKSFSKVADEHRLRTFTVDNDKKFLPDLCIDILELDYKQLPENCFILWASPPCQTFSVASIGKHWQISGGVILPKTEKARDGLDILAKTIEIIRELKPSYWFIENPRAMMRVVIPTLFKKYGLHWDLRATVTYCQYGDTRMKPTDIWTNCLKWNPRSACRNGDRCHQPAPRGTKQGTQGLKTSVERGVVPYQLCDEVISCCQEVMELV